MDKIELILAMLEKDKENYQAWFLLAEEYLENGNLSEALAAYSNALKQKDDKLESLVIENLKKYLLDGQADSVEKIKPIVESHLQNVPVNEPEKPAALKVIKGNKQADVISIDEIRPERVTFADVGGLESLKNTIEMKIIKPFMNPGLFTKFRKKSGGGILLYGPPGCGKTFIAKATAGECGANFYPVHISEILDPYFGVSEQKLHDVFETARMNRPSVLFFDELDSLGYSRAKSRSDLMRPLVDTMLTELQSINTSTDKMLIIGATNMPWDVDAAFKRPGRFDKLVFVGPPDEDARKIIFELKLQGKPFESGIDLDMLAEKTNHYSGADIENVVEIAIENVLSDIIETNKERHIRMEDLLHAISSTRPSTIEWLNTIKNYIKYSNQSGLYNDAAKYLKEFL